MYLLMDGDPAIGRRSAAADGGGLRAAGGRRIQVNVVDGPSVHPLESLPIPTTPS